MVTCNLFMICLQRCTWIETGLHIRVRIFDGWLKARQILRWEIDQIQMLCACQWQLLIINQSFCPLKIWYMPSWAYSNADARLLRFSEPRTYITKPFVPYSLQWTDSSDNTYFSSQLCTTRTFGKMRLNLLDTGQRFLIMCIGVWCRGPSAVCWRFGHDRLVCGAWNPNTSTCEMDGPQVL